METHGHTSTQSCVGRQYQFSNINFQICLTFHLEVVFWWEFQDRVMTRLVLANNMNPSFLSSFCVGQKKPPKMETWERPSSVSVFQTTLLSFWASGLSGCYVLMDMCTSDVGAAGMLALGGSSFAAENRRDGLSCPYFWCVPNSYAHWWIGDSPVSYQSCEQVSTCHTRDTLSLMMSQVAMWTWWWWWLFPRVPGFLEDVLQFIPIWQFIPRLHFFFFSFWSRD